MESTRKTGNSAVFLRDGDRAQAVNLSARAAVATTRGAKESDDYLL